MNLLVVLEHRFESTPDGAVWTQTAFGSEFWSRYLEVFERVCVVARVRPVHAALSGWKRADGQEVSFVAVPYYLGPWQYLRRARQVRRVTRSAVGPADAVILRVASHIAACVLSLLHGTSRPYGLEVVGDPHDVFAPGVITHPLRPLLRWWFPRQLRRQCAQAQAIAYVTEQALQRRYPAAPGTFSTFYSDVQLPDAAFVSTVRSVPQGSRPYTLIMVGSLAQLYKAPDVLIDAVAACVRGGLALQLVIVGDGKYRPELQARVAALGLADHVRFLGQLPAGEAVRAQLDQADLFVLPSRTEGLPRALIEAMARGLPCIGSAVGGIPELLAPEDLVQPDDATALVAKLREVVSDPQRLVQMAARNLAKAREYHEGALRQRQRAFYQYIREKTEEWLQTQKR